MKTLLFICLFLVALDAHTSEEETITLPMRFAGADVDDDSHTTAFIQSFSAIFVSEIGDRTFFVAAVMAMRYNKQAVFVGSAGALVLMTLISCIFGYIVPQLIPKVYTQFLAMILFFFFGIKLLYEWYNFVQTIRKYGESHNDEKQEVEQEMFNLHKKLVSSASQKALDNEQEQVDDSMPIQSPNTKQSQASEYFCIFQVPLRTIISQAFCMTFLGEWGDRSQFATISLAAVHHAWIVFIGGSLGHILCTIIAIVAGDMVSEKITEKTVNLVGGVVFTIFGILQGLQLLTQKK